MSALMDVHAWFLWENRCWPSRETAEHEETTADLLTSHMKLIDWHMDVITHLYWSVKRLASSLRPAVIQYHVPQTMLSWISFKYIFHSLTSCELCGCRCASRETGPSGGDGDTLQLHLLASGIIGSSRKCLLCRGTLISTDTAWWGQEGLEE